MIDPDEMVDMCFDFLSFARQTGVKVVVFKPKKRALHDYLRNSLTDQEFVVKAMAPDYNKRGELYYPMAIDISASYT